MEKYGVHQKDHATEKTEEEGSTHAGGSKVASALAEACAYCLTGVIIQHGATKLCSECGTEAFERR